MPRRSPDKLFSAEPETTLAAIEESAGDLLVALDHAIAAALAGERSGAVAYLRVLAHVEERLLVRAGTAPPDAAWEEVFPLEAPFSPWAERYGRSRGTALAFVANLRSYLPPHVAPPLSLPVLDPDHEPSTKPTSEEVHRFLRLVLEAISGAELPLARVTRLFDLSHTELARLFGVSRQAASQWLETGVPAARAPKLNALARLADILERNLKADRIPGVVRRPAESYGGLTMLEMIEHDRHEELLRQVEDAFDWAQAA